MEKTNPKVKMLKLPKGQIFFFFKKNRRFKDSKVNKTVYMYIYIYVYIYTYIYLFIYIITE